MASQRGQYTQRGELWVERETEPTPDDGFWRRDDLLWSHKVLFGRLLKTLSVKAEIFTVPLLSELQLIRAARRDFRRICKVCRRPCHNMDWCHVGRLVLCATSALLSCWTIEEKATHSCQRSAIDFSQRQQVIQISIHISFDTRSFCRVVPYLSFCLQGSV